MRRLNFLGWFFLITAILIVVLGLFLDAKWFLCFFGWFFLLILITSSSSNKRSKNYDFMNEQTHNVNGLPMSGSGYDITGNPYGVTN